MTDIEELVRESLRTAPAVTPTVSDPIGAVSARVRRARRRAVAAVAAVVAVVAIAVPLALLGRPSSAGRLVPAITPSPTSTKASDGATVWDRSAVAVTAGDGWLWELQRDANSSNGSGRVIKLDPRTHRALQSWTVAAPYDRISYGLERVWVWGGGDGGYPNGLLQIIAPNREGVAAASVSRPGVGFRDVAFTVGTAWVTTGDSVWQINVNGDVLAKPRIGPGVERIVAVGSSLWVATPTLDAITQLTPNASGVGAAQGVVQMTQDAPLRLLGTFGPNQLIVSNGNDVRTEPVPSAGGEGGPGDNAVGLPGAPTMAVELANGDVAAVVGAAETSEGTGVYVISGATFRGTSPCVSVCAAVALSGDNVLSLVVNPAGGVDVVLDDGTAEHREP